MRTFALIAIASLATLTEAATPVKASKVCVQNSGWYAMQWWYKDLNSGVEGTHSDNYAAGHVRCMDINTYGSSEGDLFDIMVHAQAGVTKSAESAIIWDKMSAAATYTCTGSTVSFSCRLNGAYAPHYTGEEDHLDFALENVNSIAANFVENKLANLIQ